MLLMGQIYNIYPSQISGIIPIDQVTTVKVNIGDHQVNTQHIEPDSVINAKILTDTIESDSILDGTIKSIDIGLETIELIRL